MVERAAVGDVDSRVFRRSLSQSLLESLCKGIGHIIDKFPLCLLQFCNGEVSNFLLYNEVPLRPLQLFNRGVARG